MAKKKVKVNGIELPYDFETTSDFYDWANSPVGAALLEDYFKSEYDHGTITFNLGL